MESPNLTANTHGWGGHLALVCVLLGFVVSLTLSLLSDGSYHDDALTHYLYARWAWHNPAYLFDAWGRPGLTCLLLPLAKFGWTACRVESAVLSAVSAWLAYDVARRLGYRRAGWVPLLCFAQPLFLLASYTTLTETAVAFYLALAVWFMVRQRPAWSAALVSLCFVTRYETLVFAPLWALAIWRQRGSWWAYACLLWAPLAHNLLGVLFLEGWPIWFIIGADHPDHYGAGTPLSMLVKSMATSGAAVAVLAAAGLFIRPAVRGAWFVPACYGLHLAAQSAIYWLGLFASGGYARFLISTSPLAAVCAVAALETVLDGRGSSRRPGLPAVAAVTVVMWIGIELEAGVTDEAWLYLIQPVQWLVRGMATVVLLAVGWLSLWRHRLPAVLLALGAVAASVLPLAYLVRPHRMPAHTRDVQDAVAWLRASPHAAAPVIATNIWVSHFLDRGVNVIPPDSTQILDELAAGTVFFWDGEYSPSPRFDISADSMTQRRGWRLIWTSTRHDGDEPFCRVYLLE